MKDRSLPDLTFTFEERRTPEARAVRSVVTHPRYEATSDLRANLAVLTLREPADERSRPRSGPTPPPRRR